MRQDGRIPRGLQKVGAPLVVTPRLLDALTPDFDLHPFRVHLCHLLRLQLERWNGITLGAVLLDRVEHHTKSAWAALLRRCRRDILLHHHQYIAMHEGW